MVEWLFRTLPHPSHTNKSSHSKVSSKINITWNILARDRSRWIVPEHIIFKWDGRNWMAWSITLYVPFGITFAWCIAVCNHVLIGDDCKPRNAVTAEIILETNDWFWYNSWTYWMNSKPRLIVVASDSNHFFKRALSVEDIGALSTFYLLFSLIDPLSLLWPTQLIFWNENSWQIMELSRANRELTLQRLQYLT